MNLTSLKHGISSIHKQNEENMQLDEAIARLNKAGFLVEGSMSLKDKIANAKQFNAVY